MSEHIAHRLRSAAADLPGERVSVATLAELHESSANAGSAHGALLLMMAVPCVLPIPGTGTVLGLGLLALAVAIWRGDLAATLPRRVAEFEMSREWAQKVLGALASVYGLASRFSRERLQPLASGGGGAVLAVAVALMAAVLIMPIPFGNVLPAVALVLIGLGLVFRDGLAVLLGLGTAALTVGGLVLISVLATDWAASWLPRLWA
ncbi:exopolysaccharide biosynthesis protein [Rubrivivax rivuli]|uniref:Exopolysaccharide biosynthesis protein n=1 Tax=Rubrivivax rivuli TaxID=1862385 RepID=A0A437RAN1_9BURK|nr:exopolysaccharide biosynthesis protein [Rubrivivax rivuli]RVU43803.1 hypothetical protein EOE66_19220 [Rubrivivax rivuli]